MPILPPSSSTLLLDEEVLPSSMQWMRHFSSSSSKSSVYGTFISCIFLMVWSSLMVNIGVQIQRDIFMYRDLSSKLSVFYTVNTTSHDQIKWFFGILMVLTGVMGDCVAFSMLSLTHGVLLITGVTALFQVFMTHQYQPKRIQRHNNFASSFIFLSLILLSWTFAPNNSGMNETSGMMERRSSSSWKMAGVHLLLSLVTIGLLYYVIQESYYVFVSLKDTDQKEQNNRIGAKCKQTVRVLCRRLLDLKTQKTSDETKVGTASMVKAISSERSQLRVASFAIMAAIVGSFAIYFEKCIGDLFGFHYVHGTVASVWVSASLFGWMMATAMQVHWWHRCLQEQQQDLDSTPEAIGFGWNYALRMYLTIWTLCGMVEGVIAFGDLADSSLILFAIGFAAFVVGMSHLEHIQPSSIIDGGPKMIHKDDVRWIEVVQPLVPLKRQIDAAVENSMLYPQVDAIHALDLEQEVSYRPPAYMRTL